MMALGLKQRMNGEGEEGDVAAAAAATAAATTAAGGREGAISQT